MQKLTNLKTKEVSLVPQGANRRRFMIYKSAMQHEDLQKAIAQADPEVLKSVGKILDKHIAKDAEDGSAVRAAMQGVTRILSSIKGKISPAAAHEALDEVGFKMGEGELGGAGATSVGEAPTHGETVNMGKEKEIPEEAMKKARECAEKAYDEEMKKLGHSMYPDAQIQMKSKAGMPMKKKKEEEEEDEVEKSAKLDADTQTKLDAIFKANENLVKQNEELRSEVSALQQVNKQKELVQKAASFGALGLPQEMIVETLSIAQKAGTEAFDKVVKQYEMLTERAKVAKSFGGNLFSEIGSSLPGGGGAGSESTWQKIEKAAEGFVQKSAFAGTKEQAVAKFLETPEGTRLYAEHQAGRKDNI